MHIRGLKMKKRYKMEEMLWSSNGHKNLLCCIEKFPTFSDFVFCYHHIRQFQFQSARNNPFSILFRCCSIVNRWNAYGSPFSSTEMTIPVEMHVVFWLNPTTMRKQLPHYIHRASLRVDLHHVFDFESINNKYRARWTLNMIGHL